MGKSLLILTTGGVSRYLHDAIETLDDPLDVLVVDDGSPRSLGIEEFCRQKGLYFIGKNSPAGLTNSWNIGFRFMVERGYQNCILSNDDVRFAPGFSRDLLEGTVKFAVVCPVSNRPTSSNQRFRPQWAKRYCELPMSSRKKNRRLVQEVLRKKYKRDPLLEVKTFNGFCFAFSRLIEKYMFSGFDLFNPGLINTKNDIELGRRIRKRGGRIAVSRTSYVFHWKAGTFKTLGLVKKDWLWPVSPVFKES